MDTNQKKPLSAVAQLVGPHVHRKMLRHSRLKDPAVALQPRCEQQMRGEVLPSPFDDYRPPK